MEEIYIKSKKDNLGFAITCFTSGFDGQQVQNITDILTGTTLPWRIGLSDGKIWIKVDNVD